MIAKKVPNPKKSTSKVGRATGLIDYITAPEQGQGQENGVEKCIHHECVNFMTQSLNAQKLEMTALSQEAPRSKDPIDHWVLSFKENERPTADQAREAVALFVDHCGLNGHLYVWGMHQDTRNVHIHIGINRVHPDTFKVIKINKGFDREAAQQAIAMIEHRQGWQQQKGARYDIDEKGKPIKRALEQKPAYQQRQSISRQPTTKARDMELQTGEKSHQRIAQEIAAPIICDATSWQALHTKLAEVGMRYVHEGSGAKVYVGDAAIGVKASDVDRKASFGQLQQRLGVYEPISPENTRSSKVSVPSQPLAPKQDGWHEYRQIRDEQRTAKDAQTLALKTRHDAERKKISAEQNAEREQYLSGDWRGKGALRNALQSVLATQQAAQKLEIAERQAKERKALREQFMPLPMYRQWKDQPRIVSLVQRSQHEQQAEREKLSDVFKELTHTIDQRGHVTYSADGNNLFRDEGRSIAVLDTTSERAIGAALATAQAKFGNTVTLVGSNEFKQQAVAAAVKNNLSVRFSDPDLNQLREQMYSEKMQAEQKREREQAQRVMTERALESRLAEKTKQLDKGQEHGRGRERDDGPDFSR